MQADALQPIKPGSELGIDTEESGPSKTAVRDVPYTEDDVEECTAFLKLSVSPVYICIQIAFIHSVFNVTGEGPAISCTRLSPRQVLLLFLVWNTIRRPRGSGSKLSRARRRSARLTREVRTLRRFGTGAIAGSDCRLLFLMRRLEGSNSVVYLSK